MDVFVQNSELIFSSYTDMSYQLLLGKNVFFIKFFIENFEKFIHIDTC